MRYSILAFIPVALALPATSLADDCHDPSLYPGIGPISPRSGSNEKPTDVTIEAVGVCQETTFRLVRPEFPSDAGALSNVGVTVDDAGIQHASATVPAGLLPGAYSLEVVNPSGRIVRMGGGDGGAFEVLEDPDAAHYVPPPRPPTPTGNDAGSDSPQAAPSSAGDDASGCSVAGRDGFAAAAPLALLCLAVVLRVRSRRATRSR
jgi:hypothetical protein